MASIVAACRASVRVSARRLPHHVSTRGFRTSAAALAAQNFSMPALSPTMTEGNISAWRVKQGDKFVAGDVLLEIETDKATMDVEAQEDGVLVKIMQPDGSKGVAVGTRIAVLAEDGDDIASLEIPPDNSPKQQDTKPADTAATAQQPEHGAPTRAPPPAPDTGGGPPSSDKRARVNSFYPLYPSVAILLAEHGIAESATADMTPTGPNGRLLKGDVLAYLGKIDAKSPTDIEARFDKAAHLDLSNVKAAAKSSDPTSPSAEEPPAAPAPDVVQVRMRLSGAEYAYLAQVGSEAAARFANSKLPLPAGGAQPSTSELFNQVLGLEPIRSWSKPSRGSYKPDVTLMPVGRTELDIIEELTSRSKVSVRPKESVPYLVLRVSPAEETRAMVFFKRFLSYVTLAVRDKDRFEHEEPDLAQLLPRLKAAMEATRVSPR